MEIFDSLDNGRLNEQIYLILKLAVPIGENFSCPNSNSPIDSGLLNSIHPFGSTTTLMAAGSWAAVSKAVWI